MKKHEFEQLLEKLRDAFRRARTLKEKRRITEVAAYFKENWNK